MDSQIEENYNSLTWREQKHRREFFTYWRVELMRLPPHPHPTPDIHLSRTADSWNVLVKSHNYYMKLWNQSCKHRPWTECRQCQHEENWGERQKRKEKKLLFNFTRRACVLSFISVCFVSSRSSRQRCTPAWSKQWRVSDQEDRTEVAVSSAKDWLEREWVSIKPRWDIHCNLAAMLLNEDASLALRLPAIPLH